MSEQWNGRDLFFHEVRMRFAYHFPLTLPTAGCRWLDRAWLLVRFPSRGQWRSPNYMINTAPTLSRQGSCSSRTVKLPRHHQHQMWSCVLIFHGAGEAPGQRAFFSYFDHHGRPLLEARDGGGPGGRTRGVISLDVILSKAGIMPSLQIFPVRLAVFLRDYDASFWITCRFGFLFY